MHVSMKNSACLPACLPAYLHACVCACVRACVRAYLHACMSTFVHACMCARLCIHASLRVYVCKHKCTTRGHTPLTHPLWPTKDTTHTCVCAAHICGREQAIDISSADRQGLRHFVRAVCARVRAHVHVNVPCSREAYLSCSGTIMATA